MNFLQKIGHLFSIDTDREYRMLYINSDYIQAILSLLFFTLPGVSVIFLDYTFLGFSSQFYILLTLRLLGLFYVIAIAVVITKIKNYILLDWSLFVLTLMGSPLTFYVALTRPITYTHNYVFEIIIIMAYYLIVPNRFLFKTISGVLYSLLSVYTLIFVKTHTTNIIFLTLICIIFVNIFGIIIAKRMTVYRYKQYKTQKQDELLKAELAKSNADLKEFAHIVAHDLKSPLTGLIGYLNLLLNEAKNKFPSETGYISSSIQTAYSMQQIIDDLLVFSTIDKQHISSERVNLKKVFNRILENLSNEIVQSAIKIEIGEMPSIHGSFTLFTLLFQNLIQNAVKFRNKENPFIIIHHEIIQDNVIFYVKDNGIGIPDVYKDKIFDLFYKVHSKKDYSGSGIGLSTCKKIVELYSGNITVNSSTTDGTTFIIQFPSSIMINYK